MSKGYVQLLTAREISAGALARWRSQYADWAADDEFHDGTTKKQMDAALNKAPKTPEGLAKAFGGKTGGWTHPQCECCREYFDEVAAFVDAWGDEVKQLCLPCIKRGASVLKPKKGRK